MDYNSIIVDINPHAKHLEGVLKIDTGRAATTVLPGHLMQYLSDTNAQEFDTSKLSPSRRYYAYSIMIAVENIYEGNTINDPYLEGNKVYCRVPLPGDVVRVRTLIESGDTLHEGHRLIGDSIASFDGQVRKTAVDADRGAAKFIALETYTNTSGADEPNVLIKAQVI